MLPVPLEYAANNMLFVAGWEYNGGNANLNSFKSFLRRRKGGDDSEISQSSFHGDGGERGDDDGEGSGHLLRRWHGRQTEDWDGGRGGGGGGFGLGDNTHKLHAGAGNDNGYSFDDRDKRRSVNSLILCIIAIKFIL